MTIDNIDLLSILDRGGTVVVPSRQRAVAVRLAHTRHKIAQPVSAWVAADVLSWSAWLERCAQLARRGALQGLRRLGAAEEWLLWREAAERACEHYGVLLPASLADPLRRSNALVRDWSLRWPAALTSESEVLEQACQHFARRCQELRAYALSDWTLVLRGMHASAPLVFAGFPVPGSALRSRLVELGSEFWPAAGGGSAGSVPARVVAAHDSADELRRAAQWACEQLRSNPAARLLVVVPQLPQQRAAAVRAFEHGLPGEPLFAIEGGQPLIEHPMVQAALGIIGWGGAPLRFGELAALWRSPYLGIGTAAQRAVLELSLRDRDVTEADFAGCVALARTQRQPALAEALQALEAIMRPTEVRCGAAAWAQRFAAQLEACGWPGPQSLGSAEQQQRDRCRELLGELALLEGSGTRLEHGEALELLRALAVRTAFDPASGDVPVTLTASLDDPVVGYDGIWVCGLGAETWPPPSRPDPFVPIAAQRAAGVPQASPTGQHAVAQMGMAAWQRCAGALEGQWVLSWPQFDGDVPLRPSGLITDQYAGRPAAESVLPGADPLLVALRHGARRDPRAAEPALIWPAGRRLAGGTRALQLQSLCPFRAVAELRLDAAPLPEPSPGFNARERGRMLHRALQWVWSELGDSRALRAARDTEIATLANTMSERALRETLAQRAMPVAPSMVANEEQRLAKLITMLLRQELQRAEVAEFSIAQLETTHDHELGGRPIRVRMDRLDRLDDGRVVVIDYKSGAAESFRPLDERPRQPQLLAYALLAAKTAAVAAVAAVHLNADEIRWRGAEADAVLPDLARIRSPAAPWPELLSHWQRVIHGLVDEFVSGVATVTPLPGSCDYCHLAALCRIDALGPQPLSEAEAGDEH